MSGRWIELAGREGRFMQLSWACKRQGATAGHTQEAETVSLASCLKEEALALQTLVQTILRRPVPLIVKEDNSACIQAVRKGYSPTLRHLKRTQRISLGDLHETFEGRNAEGSEDGPVKLEHADTKTHKGDVFTKYMSPMAFREAVSRLGVMPRCARIAGAPARAFRKLRRTDTHTVDLESTGFSVLPGIDGPLRETTGFSVPPAMGAKCRQKARLRKRRHRRELRDEGRDEEREVRHDIEFR